MDKGLVTVVGMSIAYVASLLGMCLAWWSWRKRHGRGRGARDEAPRAGSAPGPEDVR